MFCATSQGLVAQAFRETTASGDTPAEARRPQDSLIVGVNLDSVSILVTARNTKGDYISSLKSNDFQVLEDGDEQPISYFKQDTVPVNVVFLVDASYSVNDVLANIIDAAVTFAGHLRKDDKYARHLCPQADQSARLDTDLAFVQNILKNIKTFGKMPCTTRWSLSSRTCSTKYKEESHYCPERWSRHRSNSKSGSE
jgi:hypothetical protein